MKIDLIIDKFATSFRIAFILMALFCFAASVRANDSTYYSCEVNSVVRLGIDGNIIVPPNTNSSMLRLSNFVVQKETGDVHGGIINVIGKPSKKILFEPGGQGNFFRVIWHFEKPHTPGVLYLSIRDVRDSRLIKPPYSFVGTAQDNFITGLCK
jgi:hypothetical protein